MIKLVTIVGARPQFIKAASVSRAIAAHNISHGADNQINEIIVHTGQHYDANMSNIFFKELNIPEPDYNLGVGSGLHGDQTGQMLAGIEKVLLEEKPQCVLTYGDTNSTAAGALAAAKLQIVSAHVEAGLRSYNRAMPEEINRLVADEISNVLFCPTRQAIKNLEKEGIGIGAPQNRDKPDINSRQVCLSGDVMYDSILHYRNISEQRSTILERMNLLPFEFCLATLHRAENTDKPERLGNILDALKSIGKQHMPVILPLHPRTRKCIKEYGWIDRYGFQNSQMDQTKSRNPGLVFVEPLGYLDMIRLQSRAKVVFTDSGGVQKEAFFMKAPCVTLRTETEWVETVANGWNRVVGVDPNAISDAFTMAVSFKGQGSPYPSQNKADELASSGGPSGSPYGDGHAADIIIETLSNLFLI